MIREKLFEPFTSMKENGSGLGLFISNNIVKKHKGEIVLDEKYAGGAHIIVKMPKGDFPTNE
jgi:signal transduction histidine kinase